MAQNIVGHILLHQQTVYGVDGDGTVEGVVDATPPHVGSRHVTVEMEVDGVTSEPECLASVSDLHVLYPSCHVTLILLCGMDHDLRAKLVSHHLCSEPPQEAGLHLKLTWSELLGTRLHLSVPFLIDVSSDHHVPGEVAHLPAGLQPPPSHLLHHGDVLVLQRGGEGEDGASLSCLHRGYLFLFILSLAEAGGG